MSGRLFDLGPAEPGTAEPEADTEAALAGPLRRVMLLVAYEGTDFRGFAVQRGPDVPTVGGELVRVLTKMADQPVSVTCAGRTDAGVHAAGQVVHADLPEAVLERYGGGGAAGTFPGELAGLARSLSAQTAPAIAVTRALIAPEGFDARRSAIARRYRYDLLRSMAPQPLLRRTTWHVPGQLEIGAMRIATDALLGKHDFSAFCKRPPGETGPVIRRVTDVSWTLSHDRSRLCLEIEANAFCHHMVRSVVGSLVGVGQGRLTAADMVSALRTGERTRGGRLAPAEGLCLVLVRYPVELIEGGVLRPPGEAVVA